VQAPAGSATTFVAISGKPAWNEWVDDSSRIADALDLVGPLLKRIRSQRGVTLAELSERNWHFQKHPVPLENGQRPPSLELLLPLAQDYRVPLDDLVGAETVPGSVNDARRFSSAAGVDAVAGVEQGVGGRGSPR